MHANLPVYLEPVEPVAAAPQVTVEELYLDAMFAIPSAVISPPKSIAIPFHTPA